MTGKPLRLIVHVDGGARGNPGPAAAGLVVSCADDGTVLREAGIFLGETTNNVAEYRALLAGLAAAAELGAQELEVRSDSQLLVRQMTGQYRVKNANLKELFQQAQELEGRLANCAYRHVPRKENERADRLVNRAINLKRNVEDAAE